MAQRIAVVSGANRGIGLEISRQLAKQGIFVVLTARSAAKAATAFQKLKSEKMKRSKNSIEPIRIRITVILNGRISGAMPMRGSALRTNRCRSSSSTDGGM